MTHTKSHQKVKDKKSKNESHSIIILAWMGTTWWCFCVRKKQIK